MADVTPIAVDIGQSRVDTDRRRRQSLDTVLGKPPRGLSEAARKHWYSVMGRYPQLKPQARGYAVNYIEAYDELLWLKAQEEEADELPVKLKLRNAIRQLRGTLTATQKALDQSLSRRK